MSNELTIGIIGLYTIVYVIVFFIQKAQMDKQKEVINSMKSFVDIFKVDEVKKYVELKEERLTMSFKNFMADDEYLKNLTLETVEQKSSEIKTMLAKEFGEKYLELASIAIKLALKEKPENREQFIKDVFPENQHFLIESLNGLDKKV